MKIQYYFLCAVLMLGVSFPAFADDFDRHAPEYSGPSARFDDEMENYRSDRATQRRYDARAEDAARIQRNDRAYDAITGQRSLDVQREMNMRRDEVRRPYYNE